MNQTEIRETGLEPPHGGAPLQFADTAAAVAGSSRARHRASRTRLMMGLIAWDAITPAVLLTVAALFSSASGAESDRGPAEFTSRLALCLALASPVALGLAGAYDHRRRRETSRLVFAMRLLLVGVTLSWISILLSSAAGWPVDHVQMFALAVLLPWGWIAGRSVCDRHPGSGTERALLIGSGCVAELVADLAPRHPERRIDIVGRVDAKADEQTPSLLPFMGNLPDLPRLLTQHDIDRVIVAFFPGRDSQLLAALRSCVAEGVSVDIVPRFYDLAGPAPRAHALGRLPLIEIPGRGLSAAQRVAKRSLDIVGATALILLFAPLFGFTSLAILLFDGRPIFFVQRREGQNGRPFRMLKFRTMSAGSEPPQLDPRLPDDPADAAALIDGHKTTALMSVTGIGAMLRRASLDELPQLWNVVRGDMSLVGPRPLPLYESEHLKDWHLARQDLKPGLTGLWQVSGRSALDWNERMHLDYDYVSHWSLAFDIRILAKTLPAVLRRKGAI